MCQRMRCCLAEAGALAPGGAMKRAVRRMEASPDEAEAATPQAAKALWVHGQHMHT